VLHHSDVPVLIVHDGHDERSTAPGRAAAEHAVSA
jgi:hypothetical protein